MKNTVKTLSKVLSVAVLLYLFLVSVGLMGSALKGYGKGFAAQLIETTSNPFIGLFIGILATSLIQSSSTTTSIVVGMVASNVLTVHNAIPIIMGANIGTTVTNTLVSLGHVSRRDEFRRAISAATVHDFFNLICVAFLFPLEQATGYLEKLAGLMKDAFKGVGGIKFTSPVKLATEPVVHLISDAAGRISGSKLISCTIMLIISVLLLFYRKGYEVAGCQQGGNRARQCYQQKTSCWSFHRIDFHNRSSEQLDNDFFADTSCRSRCSNGRIGFSNNYWG